MRRSGLGLLSAAALLAGAVPATAQTDATGRLDVTLTPVEITVGDRVEAEITLVWTGPPPASEPRFPAWQETWGTAEVLAAGEVVALTDPGSGRVYRQTVLLTAFRTGEVELPAVTVAVPLGADTVELTSEDAARFAVRSVLPADGDGELEPRAAAPLAAFDAGSRFPWTVAALAALGLLAAWRLARRLGEPGALRARRRREPLEELFERLALLDPAAGEPAHTGLSLGLRHYLGRSLGLHAVESTTSEIQRRLHRTPVAPTVAQGAVRLLRDCDQVKFARVRVDATRTGERLLAARHLAREIDDGLRPGEPAEAAE